MYLSIRRRGWLLAAAGMMTTALLGCGSEDEATGGDGNGPSQSAANHGATAIAEDPNDTPDGASDEITAQYMDLDELQQLIDENRGTVVVLDVWNTACLPCIRELPHLAELQERYGAERITCITLNTDYYGAANRPPEFFEEDVLDVLREKEMTVVNVICETEIDAVLEWLGAASVPIVRVYDAEGDFRQFPESGEPEVSYEENVFPHVAELIGE